MKIINNYNALCFIKPPSFGPNDANHDSSFTMEFESDLVRRQTNPKICMVTNFNNCNLASGNQLTPPFRQHVEHVLFNTTAQCAYIATVSLSFANESFPVQCGMLCTIARFCYSANSHMDKDNTDPTSQDSLGVYVKRPLKINVHG